MGIVDKLREMYFSLEDRYYKVLDGIESKGVPVYTIIDPLDSVVPTFPLAVLVLLLLIGAGIWFLVLPLFASPLTTLTVNVVDFSDDPLSGARVVVTRDGTQTIGITDVLGKTVFEFPKDSIVSVHVSREGFEDFDISNVELTESKQVIARLSAAGSGDLGEAVVRTIRLLSQAGQPLVGEDITVSFSCANPQAIAPSAQTTTTGEVKVTEPGDCQGLIAKITSRNFKEIFSQPITLESQPIYLVPNSIALDEERGTIEVLVSYNEEPVLDGTEILLYSKDTDLLEDVKQTSNGKAVFTNIAYGKYTIKNRTSANYGPKSVSVTLASKKETVGLALERNIAGSIRIKVIDEMSREAISGAEVSLRFEETEIEKKTSSKDNNGYVEFFVAEDKKYNVSVSHPDYCFEQRMDFKIVPGSYVVELERYTASCGGTLAVKVIDQQGLPVRNAKVSLANDQQFFIGRSAQVTDLNGIARFSGMKAETYTAFAQKGSFSGWSDPSYFNRKKDEPEAIDLVATLTIPDGIVRIKAIDKEGEPVPFAVITFVDAFDNKLVGGGAKPMDGNGELSWETRADKTVYAIIEKEGYASVASQWIEIKPSTITEQTVVLLPPITKFEVELVGLYQGNLSTLPQTDPSASLSAASEYVARFRIKIPTEHSVSGSNRFREVGLHIRTGSDSIMERDLLFLKETNAPKANGVRATSFSGNYSNDLKTITAGDAKWVNLTWIGPSADVMIVETVVKIKENAALGKKVDLYYRGWGKNGGVVRDPTDRTGNQNELYSDAKIASYSIGVGTLCDDRFCFDASVYDQKEDLRTAITDSFAAKNLQKYTLSFTIANMSKRDTDSYRNAELRVNAIEEKLKLREYTIFDAAAEGSKPITGNANSFELPRIAIGDLSPGRKVSGQVAFSPQTAGTHTIEMKIVDTDLGSVVFTKQITILSAADKDFIIVVSPEELAPGIENQVVISITDKVTGLPVSDAIVRIKDKFKNILSIHTTNAIGNVETRLPSQAPGEVLDVEVERVEYNTAVKKVTVNGQLLELSPEVLGFSVNPKTKPEASQDLKLKNIAPFAFSIDQIKLSGKLRGLIDLEAANNNLSSWKGFQVDANDYVTIPVTVRTTPQAESLDALTDLTGTATITIASQGHKWDFETPVKITVGLGGELDNPACLTLSQTEWKTSSQGKPTVLEFTIQNNCTIAGKPVALSNLEAKISWAGNQTGEFSLTTDQSNYILRTGYFLTALPTIEAGKSVLAKLAFSPNAEVIGITQATIDFQATNQTDSAPQIVSAVLNANIDIVNLLTCISVDKSAVEMMAEETYNPKVTAFGSNSITSSSPPGITGRVTGNLADTNTDNSTNNRVNTTSSGPFYTGSKASFTIKTGDCGGNTEFVLDSELDVTPKEFSLTDNASQQVVVEAQDAVPGQYGVKISVKGTGSSTSKPFKNVPVIIQANRDECILLSKYEYNIFKDETNDSTGIDTARLLNQCFDKPVSAVLDKHSLEDAMAEGQKWASMGFALSMMGTLSQEGGLFGFGGSYEDDGYGEDNDSDDLPDGVKQDDSTIPLKNADGSVTPTRTYEIKGQQGVFIQKDGKYYRVHVNPADMTWSLENGTAPVTTTLSSNNVITPTSPAASSSATTNIVNPPQGEMGPDSSTIQRTPSATQPAVVLPLTGLQFMSFLGGGGATQADDSAFDECGVPIDEDSRTAQERADAESEIQNMQMMPLFGGLLGGGNMSNPFSQAFLMYAMGTAQAYNSQSDSCITSVQRDIQFGQSPLSTAVDNLNYFLTGAMAKSVYKLLDPSGLDNTKFDGVSVAEYRRPTISNRQDNQELHNELRFVKLSNDQSLVQEDEFSPLFAILQINAWRHQYAKDQIYEGDLPTQLKQDPAQKISSKYHLQFNSYKPNTDIEISPEIGNCQIGQKMGSTGKEALPRMKFDWSWNTINWDTCDAENPDYIYCDSTQFSIALLKRLYVLQEFTTTNADTFECPSTISGTEPVEQSLSSVDLDLGVTKLEIIRMERDANIVTTLENTNNQIASGQLTTTVMEINSQTVVKTCSTPVSVLSKETSGCVAQNLPAGEYRISSALSNMSCADCVNAIEYNDSLESIFTTGFEGILTECNPVSTTRLAEFIAATEQAGKSLLYPEGFTKDKILRLVDFRAHLMKDGYSESFRNDFHEFATSESFLQTPMFYSENDGLNEYFIDKSKMEFEYLNGPQNPLTEPGIYQVSIDVNFEDTTLTWFRNSTPVAHILVSMEKTADASPASPFYFFPLDSTIGSRKGRNGYGTNFEALTPDNAMRISNSLDQAIVTADIPGSNPAAQGKALRVTDFATVNNEERGLVFSIDSRTGEWKIAPSLATPVLLKVNAVEAKDAYAFYSIEVDSQPQTTQSFLSRWSGVPPSCKDFMGDGLDKYSETPDLSANNAKCAALGQMKNVSYGFEWCGTKRKGSMALQTVFFTPASKISILRLNGKNESAEFVALSGNGQLMELNGVPGMTRNSPSRTIESVEDILELVRSEYVCVTGSQNEAHTEFFWNPKKILDSMASQRDDATRACIR